MNAQATPNTKWTYGQYVQGTTAGVDGEMTWLGPGGWAYGRGPAGVPTSGTAGIPGTWNPAPPASNQPWDYVDANTKAIAANPTTAWTTGQYILGKATAPAGDMHWNGTAWVTGRAP